MNPRNGYVRPLVSAGGVARLFATYDFCERQGIEAGHGREAEILDWDRLQEVAEWDPTYLNLEDIPR